jgi:phosphate transport system protein
MTKHLDRDMVLLHREILSLCARVEEMIDKAGRALCEGRMDLAEQVSNEDDYVDAQEVRIEEECLKMLALHHPVAIDLRRIATVVKVNNDLERIADLAVNISERARGVNEYALFKIPEGVERMVSQSTAMVRDALDAFVNLSTGVARSVILMDDKIDQLNVELIEKLEDIMRSDRHSVTPALHCFSAIRHLERIADLATNIAEDVIYLADGEIVRHKHIDADTAK